MSVVRWVPVEEKLPPEGEIVLVAIDGGTKHNKWIGALGLAIWFGPGEGNGWELLHPAVDTSTVTVTHWLYGLPDPPHAAAWEKAHGFKD